MIQFDKTKRKSMTDIAEDSTFSIAGFYSLIWKINLNSSSTQRASLKKDEESEHGEYNVH